MKIQRNKAKCFVKVPTVVYQSKTSFLEDSFFVLLELKTIDELKDSEEQLELTLDVARRLVVLIKGIISYIEDILEKYGRASAENICEIFYETDWDEKILKVASFSQLTGSKNEDYSCIEVNLYLELKSNFYYVSLSLDNETQNYFFSKTFAEKIKTYLNEAINFIERKPPLLISNFFVGHVAISSIEGKSGQIEVEIEGGIYDAGAPCIAINITENLDQDDCVSTWWISDSEALELSNFLLDAASDLKRYKFGDIGQFYENDLSQKYPWLSIKVEQCKIGNFIQISLDDELVREGESNGMYLLTGIAAEELSELLKKSIQLIGKYPPHVYKIPEPDNIKIAEIC